MNIKDLQGKLVAVLGYGGQEGMATTQYLLNHGIKPVLFDQKPWEQWLPEQREQIRNLELNFIFGPDYLKELTGFNVAFRAPGIHRLHPDLLAAEKKGLKLTSQIKWFFQHCPAKIIGVTGTKGKGTTCSLIYEILTKALPPAAQNTLPNTYITGNIGKTQPFEILDALEPKDYIVYELSSFQLQDLEQSPHIGVVLMVTQDHLDVHASVKEYQMAKQAITKYQTEHDFAVVNADFEKSVKIGEMGRGQKIFFSRQKILQKGCFVHNGQIVFAHETSNFQFPITNLQLRGPHNLENICAATAVAALLKIDHQTIQNAVENFRGLEHRLEFVAEKNGIKFYNDSISTNQDTAIAAIDSFSEPEILILGGAKKNLEFSQLGQKIAQSKNVKGLVLVGQEAGTIKQAINKFGNFKGPMLENALNMRQIVNQALSIAKDGDVIVLSPACTSFDMFKDYKDRGEQFKLAVNQLA